MVINGTSATYKTEHCLQSLRLGERTRSAAEHEKLHQGSRKRCEINTRRTGSLAKRMEQGSSKPDLYHPSGATFISRDAQPDPRPHPLVQTGFMVLAK